MITVDLQGSGSFGKKRPLWDGERIQVTPNHGNCYERKDKKITQQNSPSSKLTQNHGNCYERKDKKITQQNSPSSKLTSNHGNCYERKDTNITQQNSTSSKLPSAPGPLIWLSNGASYHLCKVRTLLYTTDGRKETLRIDLRWAQKFWALWIIWRKQTWNDPQNMPMEIKRILQRFRASNCPICCYYGDEVSDLGFLPSPL